MFKKKTKLAPVSEKPSNVAIAQSVIKPTFCNFCKSTYQAFHCNLEFWDPIQKFGNEPQTPWSECPLCGKFNKVEFE